MTQADLFTFLTPSPREVEVKVVEARPRAAKCRGFKIVRPDEDFLKTIVHLVHDDYRDAYKKVVGWWPDHIAWNFWHKKHDRVVIKRGLQ
jgi:hypothetical protein